MDQVMLKIMFGGSMFLAVPMKRRDAAILITNFRAGLTKSVVGDQEQTWAVNVSSIHAMHIEEAAPAGLAWQQPSRS